MDTQKSRLRINLKEQELEVEGSEEFVREYAEKFEHLLSALGDLSGSTAIPEALSATPLAQQKVPSKLPSAFGEYLLQFPRSITDIDRMLIAAYYIQSNDPDIVFTTRSANTLLKEQGVKVANAADCVKKSTKTKRVFTVERGKYRVSQTGIEHINSLLSTENE